MQWFAFAWPIFDSINKLKDMNRLFFIGVLVASAITVNAQDNAQKDSLTMESMMHNLPEVMVSNS